MSSDPDQRATAYLTEDRVLRVEGREARTWLNSLVSADLRQAVRDAARYALLLNPAGGIVSDAWVVECDAEEPDVLALVLPAGRAARVFEVLSRYLLNEEVSLRFDDNVRVLTIPGARPSARSEGLREVATYSCDRLGVGGVDLWVAAGEVDSILERFRRVMDASTWSAQRIALGVPVAGLDFDEETSPHEAGLDGRAVSFAKGCYLGQERVARQRRLGGLTKRLVLLEIQGNEPVSHGSIVRDPSGALGGRVTSTAPASDGEAVLALAYLPPSLANSGTAVLLEERPARVRRIVGQAEFPYAQIG